MSTPISDLPGGLDDIQLDDIPLTEEEMFPKENNNMSIEHFTEKPTNYGSTTISSKLSISQHLQMYGNVIKHQIFTKDFLLLLLCFWLITQRRVHQFIDVNLIRLPYAGNVLVSNGIFVKIILFGLIFILLEYQLFNRLVFY